MSLRSFLDWFGDKGDDEKRDKRESGDWSEKRSGNRVELEQDRALGVSLQIPSGGDAADVIAARVRNVSMRGCRLEMTSPADQKRLYPAQVLIASLDVESFSIPLQVEVVRLVGERDAAVRFRPPFPRELERLERFLEPRCLGRSLREIDPAALQKSPAQGKALRWCQGVNDTNLFSWLDPQGRVVQQQLVFLDRVVEWQTGGDVRTGRVKEESAATGAPGWVASELLSFDAAPDAGVVAQARTVIDASRIDAAIKKAFLENVL